MMERPTKGAKGFTQIELLAVIGIIVILAAIGLGVWRWADETRKFKMAAAQVSLLSKAIEDYHAATGSYPPSNGNTGTGRTQALRKALYLDGATSPGGKIYLPDLREDSAQGWLRGSGPTAMVIDPWGNEYRYRSGQEALNPGFDLWSTGKDGQTKEDDPKARESLDDIHN